MECHRNVTEGHWQVFMGKATGEANLGGQEDSTLSKRSSAAPHRSGGLLTPHVSLPCLQLDQERLKRMVGSHATILASNTAPGLRGG